MSAHTYNCSQQQLYTISRLGWSSCSQYLSQFAAFSTKYTVAYIAQCIAAIDAAENLPDAEQRKEQAALYKIEMEQKAKEGLRLWQTLKRYINSAFPAQSEEVMLTAAGAQHYRKAARKSWAHCTQLLHDGDTFITDHLPTLTANGNMPPAFAGTFAAARSSFEMEKLNFFTATQTAEIITQQKIKANNALHATLMSMFLAGQRIFKKDIATRHLFTFDQVLITVTGKSSG